MKSFKSKVYMFVTTLFLSLINFVTPAFAETKKNDVSSALSESGINASSSKLSSVYTDLNGVVYFIMALGGFWIIGCLVWGGMTLASSGGNPQKRTEGFIKLALTLVGAWIIFKAYDIAGWATALGSGNSK